MRVYKHQWRDGRKSKKWYVAYKDHSGRLRRVPGYVDKGATEQMGARLEKKAARIIEGLDVPDVSDRALSALIDQWEMAMLAKGDGKSHAHGYSRVVRVVSDACQFQTLRDLDGHAAQVYMEGRLQPKEGVKAWTNRTFGWYRSALLAFGYWLSEKRKLLPSNPFTAIDERNPEIGRVIVRRALTESEFRKLLAAAKKGRKLHGLTGEQRYYLYVVAARTGLRMGACCGLTPGHFDLDSPSVSSTNRLQKNRKAHTIPLAPDVAKLLRKWFKGKAPDELLWPVKPSNRAGGKMIRRDLESAGVPFETEEGRADFHSLRHFFATSLVRAGVGQVHVQRLLDHCSPSLSARYFSHLKTDELRGSVGKLPKL